MAALRVDELGDVDPGRDHRLGHAELHLLGVGPLDTLGHLVAQLAHEADDVVVVHRRLEHLGRAGELSGPMTDVVHLDVVGVPVVAVAVVDGEHVGVLLDEDRGQPAGGLFDVGRRERTGVVAARVVGHARVAVAEELDPLDAEDLRRGGGLDDAPLRQLLAVAQHALGHLAELTLGCQHEHHAVTRGRRLGHDTAGRDRLVVGMGVEGHERPPSHGPSLPELGASTAAGRESLVSPSQPDTRVGFRIPGGNSCGFGCSRS